MRTAWLFAGVLIAACRQAPRVDDVSHRAPLDATVATPIDAASALLEVDAGLGDDVNAMTVRGWGSGFGPGASEAVSWTLSMTLDLASAHGVIAMGGNGAHRFRTATVTIESVAPGARAIQLARYHVQVMVDWCENIAYQAPPNTWPGPCGYVAGQTRGVAPTPIDLIVERTTLRARLSSETFVTDRFEVSCVPTTGRGPACRMSGEVSHQLPREMP